MLFCGFPILLRRGFGGTPALLFAIWFAICSVWLTKFRELDEFVALKFFTMFCSCELFYDWETP